MTHHLAPVYSFYQIKKETKWIHACDSRFKFALNLTDTRLIVCCSPAIQLLSHVVLLLLLCALLWFRSMTDTIAEWADSLVYSAVEKNFPLGTRTSKSIKEIETMKRCSRIIRHLVLNYHNEIQNLFNFKGFFLKIFLLKKI